LGFKQDRLLDDLELSQEEKLECSERLCHICIHWKTLNHERKPIEMENSTIYTSQVNSYCESGFVRLDFYCRSFDTNHDLVRNMIIYSAADAVLLRKVRGVLQTMTL
jgi:hypothetical protein